MSQKPVAGTYRLDGMLQGPLPPGSPVVDDMKAWVVSAKENGLRFHPSVDGGSFSLLADPAVQKTSGITKGDLEDLMVDALDAFLTLLPEGARTSVYSTVRSEEFRPGTGVQTLYAVGPDGKIASEQRLVDVDTEDAPPEITPASIRRSLLPGLVVLLLGLFISSFFIDYRKLFGEARDRVVPLAKEEVVIDQSPLGKIVEVELTGVDNKRKVLLLRLKRGADWEEAMASLPGDNAADWGTFLARKAVHRGRLQAELFDKDGKLLSSGEIRIDGLRETKVIEVAVVARLDGRLARVVVRP